MTERVISGVDSVNPGMVPRMAEPKKTTDLFTRLSDLSEGAIQRLGEAPGAERFATTLNGIRVRVDELSKRVRGLEDLDKRLTELERKVDRMSKTGGSGAATTARKATTTKSSEGPRAKQS